MTTLIERMRQELVRRNCAATTIRSYLKAVEHFQQHISMSLDAIGLDDIGGRPRGSVLIATHPCVSVPICRPCSLRYRCHSFDNSYCDGIGFVFTKVDPFCGTDLDNCCAINGTICPEALELIKRFNSYAELSSSRTGAHILIRATLTGTGRQKALERSDEKLIERAKNARNGDRFRRLWEGDAPIMGTSTAARTSPCAGLWCFGVAVIRSELIACSAFPA